MNLRTFFYVIISVCFSLVACQSSDTPDSTENQTSTVKTELTTTSQPAGTPNLFTELSDCDSAVVMYYKTPGNPRFFQMVKVYDAELLRSLASNANLPALKTGTDCSSEGKIYYYGDRGAVYVLYFANSDTCKRLSFIKTGEKYGLELSPRSSQLLDSLRAFSYEPKAAY